MAQQDLQHDADRRSGSGISFTGRLASWTDARLPLPVMLRALGEEYGGRSGIAIESLANELDAGSPLKEAFAKIASQFPRALRRQLAMIADAGGDLATVLPALASLIASERRLRARMLAALSYPVLVLAMLAAVVLFTSWIVVPQFVSMYDDFGLALPQATEFFFAFSRQAPYLIAGIGTVMVGLVAVRMTPALARYAHAFLTALPLLGSLCSHEGHASLSRMLSTYFAARVPTSEALRCAAAGLVDRNLAAATLQAARQCEAGASLVDAMATSKHFEKSLVEQIRDGEQSDTLPEVLEKAAVSYTNAARRQLDFIVRTLPPLMILLVGIFLILFTVAMFIPMLKLIEGLS